MKIGKEELLTVNRIGKNFIIEHEEEILEKMKGFNREEFLKLQSPLKSLKTVNYLKHKAVIDGVHSTYKEKFGGSLNFDYNNRNREGFVFKDKNKPLNLQFRKPCMPRPESTVQYLKEKIETVNPEINPNKKESTEIGDLTGTVENIVCPKVSISNNRIQVYDSRDICILTVDLKNKSVCLHSDKFRIDSSVGNASIEEIEKVNKFKLLIQSISEQMDFKK